MTIPQRLWLIYLAVFKPEKILGYLLHIEVPWDDAQSEAENEVG